MKKTMLGMLAVAGMMALGACSNNGNCKGGSCGNGHCDEDQLYTGIVPAADCDGIRYTLHLDWDDDDNDGDFHLVQTYLQADSASVAGVKDIKTFKSKGDFTVETRDGKKFLKLVNKHNPSEVEYFMVANDSTLTLANAQMEPATDSLMNYDLKLVK